MEGDRNVKYAVHMTVVMQGMSMVLCLCIFVRACTLQAAMHRSMFSSLTLSTTPLQLRVVAGLLDSYVGLPVGRDHALKLELLSSSLHKGTALAKACVPCWASGMLDGCGRRLSYVG